MGNWDRAYWDIYDIEMLAGIEAYCSEKYLNI